MDELPDFRKRLESDYRDLTKSEKKIASFLFSSYDRAAFLPAAELAERMGVRKATVVRFARAIGHDSFPPMRRNLQEMFRAKR